MKEWSISTSPQIVAKKLNFASIVVIDLYVFSSSYFDSQVEVLAEFFVEFLLWTNFDRPNIFRLIQADYFPIEVSMSIQVCCIMACQKAYVWTTENILLLKETVRS